MAAKNEAKKPNWFVRAWNKIKEVFSELKRVTWPTFPKVVRNTCVVLVVVLAFTAAITLVNAGFNALYVLLVG